MATGDPRICPQYRIRLALSSGNYWLSSSGTTANLNTTGGSATGLYSLQNQGLGSLQNFQPTTAVITGSPGLTLTTKEKIVARLIRFTVVDPDPKLADVKPEMCILMEGTAMLNGADDKAFSWSWPQRLPRSWKHTTTP